MLIEHLLHLIRRCPAHGAVHMLDFEPARNDGGLHDTWAVREPGKIFAALRFSRRRTHFLSPVFVGEKQRDRAALEYRFVAVDQRRYLAMRMRIRRIA